VESPQTMTISHSDLRAVAEDIKRDNHASEQRLGDRIDRLTEHVRALNGKTVTHGEAIADLKPRVRGLEHELYDRTDNGQRRRTSDNPDDMGKGPTWRMVGLGVGAVIGIGMGAYEGIKAVLALVKLLSRGQ
jgi:hypothetical protein